MVGERIQKVTDSAERRKHSRLGLNAWRSRTLTSNACHSPRVLKRKHRGQPISVGNAHLLDEG